MSRVEVNPVALRLGHSVTWDNLIKFNPDYRDSFYLNTFFLQLFQGFLETRRYRNRFLNSIGLRERVDLRADNTPLKPITKNSRRLKKVIRGPFELHTVKGYLRALRSLRKMNNYQAEGRCNLSYDRAENYREQFCHLRWGEEFPSEGYPVLDRLASPHYNTWVRMLYKYFVRGSDSCLSRNAINAERTVAGKQMGEVRRFRRYLREGRFKALKLGSAVTFFRKRALTYVQMGEVLYKEVCSLWFEGTKLVDFESLSPLISKLRAGLLVLEEFRVGGPFNLLEVEEQLFSLQSTLGWAYAKAEYVSDDDLNLILIGYYLPPSGAVCKFTSPEKVEECRACLTSLKVWFSSSLQLLSNKNLPIYDLILRYLSIASKLEGSIRLSEISKFHPCTLGLKDEIFVKVLEFVRAYGREDEVFLLCKLLDSKLVNTVPTAVLKRLGYLEGLLMRRFQQKNVPLKVSNYLFMRSLIGVNKKASSKESLLSNLLEVVDKSSCEVERLLSVWKYALDLRSKELADLDCAIHLGDLYSPGFLEDSVPLVEEVSYVEKMERLDRGLEREEYLLQNTFFKKAPIKWSPVKGGSIRTNLWVSNFFALMRGRCYALVSRRSGFRGWTKGRYRDRGIFPKLGRHFYRGFLHRKGWKQHQWKTSIPLVRKMKKARDIKIAAQTLWVKGCRILNLRGVFLCFVDYAFTAPFLSAKMVQLRLKLWGVGVNRVVALEQLHMRLRLLQIALFLESLVDLVLQCTMRVLLRNIYGLVDCSQLFREVEEARSVLVQFMSWRNYANYIYITAICNVAILSSSSRLIARLIGSEIRRTRYHTRLLFLVQTVLRSIIAIRRVDSDYRRDYKEDVNHLVVNYFNHYMNRTIGIRIVVKGRFNRRRRKFLNIFTAGYDRPREYLTLKCSSAFDEGYHRQGSFGIKVALFYGY